MYSGNPKTLNNFFVLSTENTNVIFCNASFFYSNSIKRKKSSSIAIIRNIFSVFARNNIISIVTNPIAIISIKIINQITLYSWSFIRSNSNVVRINLKKYMNLVIILLISLIIGLFSIYIENNTTPSTSLLLLLTYGFIYFVFAGYDEDKNQDTIKNNV